MNIEGLLKTVYTIFHRSSIKKEDVKELAQISDLDVISFKPLNEIRLLSIYFTICALVKNDNPLIKSCKDQIANCNDPICRHCEKPLTNLQYREAIFALKDVLDELASLCPSVCKNKNQQTQNTIFRKRNLLE